MTQKDKVKELVGRGLDSYHTKSLQQIDRIERKNKEQNHKINILTSELDNDYLTKTEEGSVVSLEHSKEGMIYLDELQGNTLVNYCTDGAKELTLNGDIDVEGTNVTITEGVDNGLVDVICEGNTLVNLANYRDNNDCIVSDTTYQLIPTESQVARLNFECPSITVGKTYTCILNVEGLTDSQYIRIGITDYPISTWRSDSINISQNGLLKVLLTVKTDSKKFGFRVHTMDENRTMKCIISKPILLEGDWSNKEIPQSYFEGMKSVGECENNKFEILSQNKNFAISSPFAKATDVVITNVFLEPNTEYTISTDILFNGGMAMINNTENHTSCIQSFQSWGESKKTFTTLSDLPKGEYKLIFWKSGLHTTVTSESWLQLEKGKTSTLYISHSSNKKEISLNEPLRGNDRLRDRVVKINGKFYIERNTIEYSSNELIDRLRFEGVHPDGRTARLGCDAFLTGNRKQFNICDKYKTKQVWDGDEEGIWADHNFKMSLSVEKGNNADSLKEYLRNNPFKIVLEREKPVYEPLEVEPTLNTYTDITHISNNSTIPCNMKIKNSGYNAIIKPSTQYTVAFDTNKSGTVGLNLGGAKVTTTNNVATITTPATLTDDSLRLYGKGIKASKVRLLEGDKTNWIPSHFEGMKSSFEDKLQDDGTYKMEILSNNKNLINLDNLIMNNHSAYTIEKIKDGFKIKTTMNGAWLIVGEFKVKVKPNTNYTLGYTKTMIKDAYEGKEGSTSWDVGYTWIKTENDRTITEYKAHNNTRTTRTFNSGNNTTIRIRFTTITDYPTTTGEYNITDISLVEDTVNSTHIPQKSNKIQFSSIEPLRSVGNVKDIFVFKDGKLMIKRNVTERIIDDTTYLNSNTINDKIFRVAINHKGNLYKDNKLIKCSDFPTYGDRQDAETVFVATDLIVFAIANVRLKDKSIQGVKEWLKEHPQKVQFKAVEPTYEEIPFELQKIILEGYENGTLFFDTNIPPTATVKYAGETPIVKSVKLNKTEVLNNSNDINDNIVPYLMDMDYRVVCLQLEGGIENVSMARLFGGTYEMLQRDILSNRYSKEEYKYRLDAYLSANKITEDEYNKLGDMLND